MTHFSCLRNVVSMFHILEREIQWRRQNGRPEGFGTMRAFRPVVAVGAEDPLEDQKMLADYFRMLFCSAGNSNVLAEPISNDYPADGTDGLGGIHASVWLHALPPFAHSCAFLQHEIN